MQSIAIAFLLAAAATFTSAAPTGPATKQARSFYTCANNGFRGECSVDPCAISWCPDYKPGTYEPVRPNSFFYICSTNGFRGYCTSEPCSQAWCPDYKYGTYEPAPVPAPAPAPTPKKLWYVCASNGFRGECSSDPCSQSWCPDYKFATYEPVTTVKRADPTVCAAGTGYFQSCSNGFRGCCKSDACGNSWCPDYKYGTYEPIGAATKPETTKTTTVPEPVTKPATVNPGECAPGTGFYQVCASGFKGCCKTDACTLGYCAA